jgi:hypothetical protein
MQFGDEAWIRRVTQMSILIGHGYKKQRNEEVGVMGGGFFMYAVLSGKVNQDRYGSAKHTHLLTRLSTNIISQSFTGRSCIR